MIKSVLNPSFFVDKYGYAHLNSYPNGHVHNWTIMTISITWFVHSYCFFFQTYISCIYLVMIPAVEVDQEKNLGKVCTGWVKKHDFCIPLLVSSSKKLFCSNLPTLSSPLENKISIVWLFLRSMNNTHGLYRILFVDLVHIVSTSNLVDQKTDSLCPNNVWTIIKMENAYMHISHMLRPI